MPDLDTPDPRFVEQLWVRIELEAFGPKQVVARRVRSRRGSTFLLAAAAAVTASALLAISSLQTPQAVDRLDLDPAVPVPTPSGSALPAPVPSGKVVLPQGSKADAGARRAAAPGPLLRTPLPGSLEPSGGGPARRDVVEQDPGTAPLIDTLLFGQKIGDEDTELVTMRLDDAGDLVRLTDNSATDVQSRYSPDGRRIVFQSHSRPEHQQSQIWVMNADGGGQRRLTRTTCNTDTSAGSCMDVSPVWSPDGERIAFTRGAQSTECAAFNGCGYVYTVATDGTGVEPLTSGWRPEYAPDGRMLAFVDVGDASERLTCDTYHTGSCNGALYVIRPDGSGRRPLGVRGDSPRWSPDGRWIAYSVLTDPTNGAYQVRLVRPDGTGDHAILPLGHVQPTWSPDGRHLVTIRRSNGQWDLWISRSDGTELRQLTNTSATESLPVFRPRSR